MLDTVSLATSLMNLNAASFFNNIAHPAAGSEARGGGEIHAITVYLWQGSFLRLVFLSGLADHNLGKEKKGFGGRIKTQY